MNHQKNIWKKAESISLLIHLGYQTPQTIFIDTERNLQDQIQDIFESENYIVRPSFYDEDTPQNSQAWKYRSYWPISLKELQIFFEKNLKDICSIFWWEEQDLWSIILQEFISTNTYGVGFSRNPENILFSWWYELHSSFNGITSGKKWDQKGSLFLDYKIQKTIKRLEISFWYPQDVEFAVKKWHIYILQSRNITSGITSFSEYAKFQKMSGIFQNLDNGEFWSVAYFWVSFLENLYHTLIISWNIFWKRKKNGKKYLEQDIQKFQNLYGKYLRWKKIHSIGSFFLFFQKYDVDVLSTLYKNCAYQFSPTIATRFPEIQKIWNNYNLKTSLLLRSEFLKYKAFQALEPVKKRILQENIFWEDINYLSYKEYQDTSIHHEEIIKQRKKSHAIHKTYSSYIVMIQWKIQKKYNTFLSDNTGKIWIYRWKLTWKKVRDIKQIDIKSKKKYLLEIQSLDGDISRYLPRLWWVILINGNMYSHHCILLREHRIPSYLISEDCER